MHIGINFQRLVEVVLCTYVVFELQLAETTIIPGFVKVGLGRENVVEMLNGNYEVVVAVGDAAGNDESVGIILGEGMGRKQKEEDKDPPPAPPVKGEDPPPAPPVKGGEFSERREKSF
jgi:hypothetical protein